MTVDKPRITQHEIREQLKQDVEEFYATFRQKYLALRRKHMKEIKELGRLTNDNRGTGKHFSRSYHYNLAFYSRFLLFHGGLYNMC